MSKIELQKILNKETLAILVKDKKTLEDWLELELAKLKTKQSHKLEGD